jgi:UDP-N-acetylglucosamine 4,6-dehydratase
MSLNNKVVLITGGTGSFGKKFISTVLDRYSPRKLIVFSRDEFKQHEMRASGYDHKCLRYFIGDVRDKERLHRAFDGVDIVIHAAALKQVPACEYNPIEAVKTNVMGAANIVDASIDCEVKKVIALSTDKAANPVNIYGATKLCAERLFVAGRSYSGIHKTLFSVVRYGNVVGSRGSVIPLFLKMRETGSLPITDERMTRFWLTLQQAVEFVLSCINRMEGSEVFVPKIPSMRIVDLAKAIGPECSIKHIGIRPGEKLHEVLLPDDDSRTTIEYDDCFISLPAFRVGVVEMYQEKNGGKPCSEGFRYSSDTNPEWLTVDDLRRIISLDGTGRDSGDHGE